MPAAGGTVRHLSQPPTGGHLPSRGPLNRPRREKRCMFQAALRRRVLRCCRSRRERENDHMVRGYAPAWPRHGPILMRAAMPGPPCAYVAGRSLVIGTCESQCESDNCPNALVCRPRRWARACDGCGGGDTRGPGEYSPYSL
ncbi:hypothetical protein A9K55_005224 [Cordyceps militaris]|uniref:Uncharacterized protein n=1 Tax=Cordyceps militaris TaxID=73501 RepID=A0A2H4SP53_CORMI|nr:hypothetical protein A9K55_005224 [Cordyceps militaris]